MRGDDTQPAALFSYVQLEDRIPADHPLRVIRALIDPMVDWKSTVVGDLLALLLVDVRTDHLVSHCAAADGEIAPSPEVPFPERAEAWGTPATGSAS